MFLDNVDNIDYIKVNIRHCVMQQLALYGILEKVGDKLWMLKQDSHLFPLKIFEKF